MIFILLITFYHLCEQCGTYQLWNCYSFAFYYSVKYTDFPDCIWDVHDVLCYLAVTENGANSNVGIETAEILERLKPFYLLSFLIK